MASFGSRLRNDLAQEADEASAVLERLTAAEESLRESNSIPDAWSDDAQTGHDLTSIHNQSVYAQSAQAQSVYGQSVEGQSVQDRSVYAQSVQDQPVHNQSGYAQIVQDQSVHNQSGYAQIVQDQSVHNQFGYAQSVQDQSGYALSVQDQSAYEQPVQEQPGYDRPEGDPPVFNQSRSAQPGFDQSASGQTSYDQSEPEQSAQEQSGLHQCSNDQPFEKFTLHPGTGYQISLGPVLDQSEIQKGLKRKYYVRDTSGQAFMLAPEEEDFMADGKRKKIPRPPNAFMLYANEYRRILAKDNPNESNKEISVRLGTMWKTMPKAVKERYFEMARVVDAEHKKKYPNYVYNPKEARMRKAIREQTREQNRSSGSGKSPSPSKRPSSVSSQGSGKSAMGAMPRMLHDGKKGYMPMYPQVWGEATPQYVVPDNFMDVSAAYQNHDPGTAVYSNMMPTSWYPYYMQQLQENGAAYGQSWQQHAAPNYLQQQHQHRMQQMQAQAQAQAASQGAASAPAGGGGVGGGGGGGGYMMPFEAPAQQSMPAKPPGPPKQAKPQSEEPPTQTSLPSQTAAAKFSEPTTTSSKPSQPPSQEHAYSTPQMSPTKAYHKYLQGNELSPPTNWPSLYMYPTPDKNTAGNSQQTKSNQDKTFGYFPEVAGPQFTYYDYIVPSLDFMPRSSGDMRNMPYPTGTFVNQVFPQMAKMPEYPMTMGFRQMMPQPMVQQADQRNNNSEGNTEKSTHTNKEPGFAEQEFTVMLNVLDPNLAGASGARVIATYESENNGAKISDPNQGLKGLELEEDPLKINDSDCDLENCTFSFMQDPMYKTILKSIEPTDEQKVNQQNKNVRLVTNDTFDGRNSEAFAYLNSQNDEG